MYTVIDLGKEFQWVGVDLIKLYLYHTLKFEMGMYLGVAFPLNIK